MIHTNELFAEASKKLAERRCRNFLKDAKEQQTAEEVVSKPERVRTTKFAGDHLPIGSGPDSDTYKKIIRSAFRPDGGASYDLTQSPQPKYTFVIKDKKARHRGTPKRQGTVGFGTVQSANDEAPGVE